MNHANHGTIRRIVDSGAAIFLLFMGLPHIANSGLETSDCGKAATPELTARIWGHNLNIVTAATDPERRSTTIHDFSPAVLFFERVTNIESDTMTFVGRLPSPNLAEIIKKWERWYRDNRDQPGFHDRICRAFRVIEFENNNLEKGYARLPLVKELWVYSPNDWEKVVSHTTLGEVTAAIKIIDLSAKGEFAFVECFVSITRRGPSLFVEIKRKPRLSAYLGTWEWKNGEILVRYRLYDTEPEIGEPSLPGPQRSESLIWEQGTVQFRNLDFFPERDILMPNLHVRFISFLGRVQDQKGFHFRN